MAYEPYERRGRGERRRPMSAEQGQKDAQDAINYQAGVERAMGQSIDPVIDAGGKVRATDWAKMGPAQRARYAEQAPSDYDIRTSGIAPQFEVPMQTAPAPIANPALAAPPAATPGSAAIAPEIPGAQSVRPKTEDGQTSGGLPYAADPFAAPAPAPTTPPTGPFAPPLDPNRGYGTYTGKDGSNKSASQNPQGSIEYQGRNGMTYFIGSDVKDVRGAVEANRAGTRPSVEQVAATTPLEPTTQAPAQPKYAGGGGKEGKRKPRTGAQFDPAQSDAADARASGEAQTITRNIAPRPAQRQPLPSLQRAPRPAPAQTASTMLDVSNAEDAAAASRFGPASPYSLTRSFTPAPAIDGHPLPTVQPPAPPVKPPSLATIANLPPGAQIDPRRARMMQFLLESY